MMFLLKNLQKKTLNNNYPLKGVILKHIGKITKLSGISGELVVFSKVLVQLKPDKDDLFFIELQNQYVPFYIETVKKLGTDKFIVKFENVDTERKAIMLLEKKLFVSSDKKSVSENQPVEFSGYKIQDAKHGFVGNVSYLDNNPKNPILFVDHDGIEVLIPFNENIITEIDTKNKLIKTAMPEGLLELYIGDEG